MSDVSYLPLLSSLLRLVTVTRDRDREKQNRNLGRHCCIDLSRPSLLLAGSSLYLMWEDFPTPGLEGVLEAAYTHTHFLPFLSVHSWEGRRGACHRLAWQESCPCTESFSLLHTCLCLPTCIVCGIPGGSLSLHELTENRWEV